MDEQLNEKISKALSDPDSIKTIVDLVSSLGIKPRGTESVAAISDDQADGPGNNGLQETSVVNQLASRQSIGSAARDDRVNLLLSIKPFLNNRKQQRVDSLIKALGAVKLINAYQDSDIFGTLGLK